MVPNDAPPDARPLALLSHVIKDDRIEDGDGMKS